MTMHQGHSQFKTPLRPRWRLPAVARRVIALGILLGVVLASAQRSPGQVRDKATMLKAAWLLKFTHYVTWPKTAFERADSPLIIAVLQGGPVASVLQRRARTVTTKGRKVIVQTFKSMEEYRPCHILFVPRTVNRAEQLAAISLTRKSPVLVVGEPVLVVGETAGFAAGGGAMNFYLDVDNTLGFEINRDVTVARRLEIDARLLRLAKIVKTKLPPEE